MNQSILVVGAGPTGLVVASELRKYGLFVDIIEEREEANRFSKALSVTASSLKIFHSMKIIEQFILKGNKLHDVYIYYNKKKLTHINKRYLETIYNYFLCIPQPESECILLDNAVRMGAVLERGCVLQDLKQYDEHVEAVFYSKIEKKEIRKKYSYVIGCDGSKSTVRKSLNLKFDGKDYDMHFIMADVDLGVILESANYLADKNGFIILLPMRDNLTRIVIKKEGKLPKDTIAPKSEEIQMYLDSYAIKKYKIRKMVWSSSAPFFSRIAETNCIGRIFLAGDSYHLFSPIGGQGMNTGLQDATNLAWKLAFVLQGKACSNLLQSYHSERYTAINKTLIKTDLYTNLLANRSNSKLLQLYQPNMSNRKNMKYLFPQEFAGFLSDYSIDNQEFELIGKHVPYFELEKAMNNITSSYDFPSTGKMVIILDKSTVSKNLLITLLNLDSLMVLDISLIKLSKFKDEALIDHICLIRPDGYIGYFSALNDMQGLMHYLKKTMFIKIQEKRNER